MDIIITTLKSTRCFAVAFFLVATSVSGQIVIDNNPRQTIKSYSKVPNGYLMVLKQHQNLFDEIERLAIDEKIPSANFTGMGFVNITFGYFNSNTKQYQPGEYADVELASLHGSIAWKDGKPSVHAHGVVGDQKFEAHAGHILKATVSTGSLEVMVTVHDKQFERRRDERLGADVLDVVTY
jgi:predicted DNA-binding protein with PD1-like motif